MTAIVLGSAAGGAYPQWNCRCPVCQLAWSADPRVRPRTQCSLAVSSGDGRWAILNAAPDIAVQIRNTPALHPKGALRGSPISAVVLTGGEIDQIAGLLTLRESTPFKLYATPATHAAVASNAMFDALTSVSRRAINPGETFTLDGGLAVSMFTVPGKVPLYLEREKTEISHESAATVGLELQHERGRLVFIPAAADVTPELRARLGSADVVLFDGTLFADDEMLRTGTGQKTGRRMGHMPIDGEGGSLAALAGLAARRFYIHINNTNPIHVAGSLERRKVEDAGWQVAEDGMEIVV
ncbi:MAG TPA: pyrroloquinoline quinone biosynthesis protein PqqB [Pseudolabrys sp.]|nr:pyrroloquinoline quinone biosynthesis protein PqqB [Pseudolabrys sp.]